MDDRAQNIKRLKRVQSPGSLMSYCDLKTTWNALLVKFVRNRESAGNS